MAKALSPAQQRALEAIRTEGALFAGNGVSLPTVIALVRAGLVRVDYKVIQYTNRWQRSACYGDWGAYPVTSPAEAIVTTKEVRA